MSQITGPLAIMNGAATPVAVSFAPERIAPEYATFTERSATSNNGYKRLGVGFSAPSSKRSTARVDINFEMPVLAQVNGINTVAYTARFKGYFVLPDAMTAAERADLHAFIWGALKDSKIAAVIKDLDPLY